ncbi:MULTISPECIES: hypothetical protein [Streptomycetaceae]|uniref:hypothetical protein n=1 Tax=Streptomycetaceae TaxID=2062 RepID=UPI000213E2F6|nr:MULTISPECIES: hypothetical protein [Streptomycetaceae]CCB73513.1 putative integral membrane protein [Streptantibioticus cattleyicolor NRRL 8057 = DSM 46488]
MGEDAAWTRPAPALELLVHGVGGTTPEAMLCSGQVAQVCGDQVAGIYRRAEDGLDDTCGTSRTDIPAPTAPPGTAADGPGRPPGADGQPVQEAYCWSGLTSGNSSRALWLLLVPFMIVNLAHWMRPPGGPGTDRWRRLYDILVRLLALSLTVLLVAAACEVAVDLVAWQCAGNPACARGKPWPGFLGELPAGPRTAVAALVPTALVTALWWLSHRTWSAYEAQLPPGTADDGHSPQTPDLALPGFWYGRRPVARLRAAHTAVALCTIAVALLLPAVRAGDHRTDGAVLTAFVSATALAAAVVVCRTGRSESAVDHATDRRTIRSLLAVSLVLLAAAVAHAALRGPGTAASRLPGAGLFSGLTVVQGVLIVALTVVVQRLRRGGGAEPRAAARGFAGPMVAVLACMVGWIFAGGVAQQVADWLDGSRTPGASGSPLAGPPVLLSWQAATIPVFLPVVAVVAGVAAARVAAGRGKEAARVRGDYPGHHEQPHRTRQIAGAVTRARLTDTAPAVVVAIGCTAFVLAALGTVGAWATGRSPAVAVAGTGETIGRAVRIAQDTGSWLLGAGAVALYTLGRRAYRNPSARRTVGILWDVGTFWPRAAHPFAPPCYAERAVPDLTWRMATWTDRTDGRLVLSAHSQGTVLAASAIWQLAPRARRRVALLTYGSPLERLYGRWFPAYFGPVALASLHGEVHAWRNLWRSTDPIGGPMRLPQPDGQAVDVGPLRDPAAYERSAEHPLPTPILAHSDYQGDPVFTAERAALLAMLPGSGQLAPVPRPGQADDDAPASPEGIPATAAIETADPAEPPGQTAQGSSGRSSA